MSKWTAVGSDETSLTKWLRYGSKTLSIVAIVLIILIIGLNVFWILGIAAIKVQPNAEPEFYSDESGIGLNYSIYIDNSSPYSSNIKNVSMSFAFYNETGSLIMVGFSDAVDIPARSIVNTTFNLYMNLSSSLLSETPQEYLDRTLGSQVVTLQLTVRAEYGFYVGILMFRFDMNGGMA